ncbi:vesicular, overexpressed in cancer, prosurvival protein 1 isoform X2 [Gopherus evgoodei]|uniref:vesicular, overexpressed in cancer, prosurvival protein 1 isoform X2 n=1 Tax=Gopherus evgoodei TaxID=1825980 RepID=UPI0011CFEE72|nr:vesicular, overexpressed in cancer, prosurvival protein 1 isoform X2 [Gopherus evgoodei]
MDLQVEKVVREVPPDEGAPAERANPQHCQQEVLFCVQRPKSTAGILKGCILHIIWFLPSMYRVKLSKTNGYLHPGYGYIITWGARICRSYEDCCGSRCCVRALSIQRLWYFWFLLMMGVLFCCGAGFFIRRRMYPPPLIEEPTFNVSYTRQPANTAAGSQQPGMPYYTDPGGPVMNPMAMAFHVQPNSPQGNPAYPPPPSYCNTPPPPYEQVVKSST